MKSKGAAEVAETTNHYPKLAWYFVYRLFNVIWTRLQDGLSNFLTRLFGEPAPVEFSRIMVRDKASDLDSANTFDFAPLLWWRSKNIEQVSLSDKWSLYTVSESHAYFVQLPESIFNYQARVVPFLHAVQFQKATAVARVALGTFLDVFEQTPKPQQNIICMAPRTGSTLLAQILQSNPHTTFALSELDAPSAISLLLKEGVWKKEFASRILKASLFAYGKNAQNRKHIVLKLNSGYTRLAPLIKEVFPNAKLLFPFRRIRPALTSLDRVFRSAICCEPMFAVWKLSPSFAQWLIPLCRIYSHEMIRLKPRNVLEYGLIYLCDPYLQYLRHPECFTLPPIMYETVVGPRARDTVAQVFNALGYPESELDEGMKAMDSDSQGNVENMNKNYQGKVDRVSWTEEADAQLRNLAVRLGISTELFDPPITANGNLRHG